MGKRILVQRRGRGGMQFRAAKKGKVEPTTYPFFPKGATIEAQVVDIIHERGRGAPLARIRWEGRDYYLPAVEGLRVGDTIQMGWQAPLKPGNVLPLELIPEGSNICNIELNYGSGGALVRASGTSAILFSKTSEGTVIRLPSGKSAIVASHCRATIGVIAGGGRTEKPFLKAGKRYWLMRAKGRQYPRVRGVAMAAVYHPFGGGRHQHPGKSTSTPRNAPPGRKVGLIAPRKTGRARIPRRAVVKR